MSAILIKGLRKHIGFCELNCEIGPSPQCNIAGRRRKPCAFKGYIMEDTETLRREFGIKVDRVALVNTSREMERARRERQKKSLTRLNLHYTSVQSMGRTEQ